jgi:hypothetical protein
LGGVRIVEGVGKIFFGRSDNGRLLVFIGIWMVFFGYVGSGLVFKGTGKKKLTDIGFGLIVLSINF